MWQWQWGYSIFVGNNINNEIVWWFCIWRDIFYFDFGFGLWIFSWWFNFELIFLWNLGWFFCEFWVDQVRFLMYFRFLLFQQVLVVVVVLMGDGGGSWVVMVGQCWVDGGICILVVVLLQVLWDSERTSIKQISAASKHRSPLQHRSISIKRSMYFCASLFWFVCMGYLCVLEEEEDDEGEKKSELVLQMENREKNERNVKLIK